MVVPRCRGATRNAATNVKHVQNNYLTPQLFPNQFANKWKHSIQRYLSKQCQYRACHCSLAKLQKRENVLRLMV